MGKFLKRGAALEFIDDGASFRIRRERELRVLEHQQKRAYYEMRFGLGTLRAIRLSLIPVGIAAVIFLVIAAFVALRALFV